MFTQLVLLVSLITLAVCNEIPSTEHMAVVSCGKECKFRFCRNNGIPQDFAPMGRRVIFRAPLAASLPFICHETKTIGRILRIGEASITEARRPRDPFQKITKFMPMGLRRPFARKFFKVRPITLPPFPGKFTVVRGAFRANQQDFFNDKCIVLPIRDYEVVTGSSTRRVKTRNPNSCISFKTVDVNLLIEATWDSDDDLDLSVTEPSGTTLSPDNTLSETGRHQGSTAESLCGKITVGREQVRYLMDPGADSGTYDVSIRIKKKCEEKPFSLKLSIYSDGELVGSNSVSVAGTASGVVLTDSFVF